LVFSSKVLQRAGVRLGSREIIDRLTAAVIEQVRQEIPWRPGARDLLRDIHESGIRCALVTMSEGPLAAEILAALPAEYFEFMVTGDMVEFGKPHPEAYLRAVARMQETDPELTVKHCVALEDSIPGVTAARASGVVTVGIPHMVPLPADEGLVRWDTLVGRSASDLRQLLTGQADVESLLVAPEGAI
jgi:HAD superfamily hydrolase (TIGR01509 family)